MLIFEFFLLFIKLPQTIGYVKCFDSNKAMFFKVNDRLLKKYTKIWQRVNSLINIEFDSEPVYGDKDKYIKTKTKSKNKKYQKKMHHTNFCHRQY